MFSTKASTWIRARQLSPMASPIGIGSTATASVHTAPMSRLVSGPASETSVRSPRERIAPWSIHTAPPGSGMPPSSRNTTGSTNDRPRSV